MRSARQTRILEIISAMEIETQEELVAELNKDNYTVTQATVSRDIRELGLVKTRGMVKNFRYISPEKKMRVPDSVYLFRETVLSIRSAGNLVVVKTISGGGSSAGNTVDKFNFPEIIGSIAGDDTLLIVADSGEDAQKVQKILEDMLR